MAIRTLFFDLGNVLVPFNFQRAYAALEALSPLPIDEMAKRLRADGLVARYECGELEDELFFEEFAALTEVKTSYHRFCEIWNCIFLPANLVPESLLQSLASRYRLLLLSNTNAIHFRYLEANYSHIRHFHHLCLSHEAGAQKPARKIYDDALRIANADPAEVFFTDDMRENVEAARTLGLDAEVFEGLPALRKHLSARGVEV